MYGLEWTSETSIFHNDVLGEDIEYTKYTADYLISSLRIGHL